ncbi:hypothetical protein [Phenylobacterium sp.]|uniref:hypothetical protein n=1 Tax=Phenylobacterium sp. TaxID=1871053 RepID=UPI0025D41E2D|nr:hypothetical protein [Phenylobacterium sp.]
MIGVVSLVALTLAFSAADRFAGGGLGWSRLTVDHGGKFRGRPLWYVAAPLALLATMAGRSAGLVLAIGWIIYRGPGWRVGTWSAMTPDRRDVVGLAVAAFRHAVAFAAPIGAGLAGGRVIGLGEAAFAALLYGVAATGLGLLLAAHADGEGDPNAGVELARGAVFGLLAGLLSAA